MNLKESLNWRYAVKKYSDKKVNPADVQEIVDAINMSASSAGMQPYRVFIIRNEALKRELGEGSFNSQIAESSHLLVFAAFANVDQQIINDYIQQVADMRGVPIAQLADFKGSLEYYLLSRTAEENFNWASKQAYIGLGTGLIAAAELKIDATPMEGFDSEKFDQKLGLTRLGLKSVVLLALGYRDGEADAFSKMKKLRLPVEKFAIEVG